MISDQPHGGTSKEHEAMATTPTILICDNFLCSRTEVDDPESIEVYPGEFEPFCPTCRHGLRFVTWDIVTGR